MAVLLQSITFRHTPADPTQSAFAIRRNKDFEIPVPEWDLADPVPPVESAAAYAILDTNRGRNVIVRVTLSRTAGETGVEIRATGGGVLGPMGPVSVPFGATGQATVDVPLSRPWFSVVGRHDVVWNWSYRTTGQPQWQNLADTGHRIYLTLSPPRAPWSLDPTSAGAAWTDLLDHACVVAQHWLHDDPQVIARTLVWAINENYGLRYDIIRRGSQRYGYTVSGTEFDLTTWIDKVLNGNQQPNDPTECDPSGTRFPYYKLAACYECAASAALMAAILGVEAEYQFHEPFGQLHYCTPIGRRECNNPFYFDGCTNNFRRLYGADDASRPIYGNHAYVKLPGGNNYDACVRSSVDFISNFWYLVAAFFSALTFQFRAAMRFYDLAYGVFADVTQSDYEARLIDRSTPNEARHATGQPVPQVLDFQIM